MAGSEAPPFWFREKGWAAYSLAPLGWIYGAVARWRMDNAKPFEVMAPVMYIAEPAPATNASVCCCNYSRVLSTTTNCERCLSRTSMI